MRTEPLTRWLAVVLREEFHGSESAVSRCAAFYRICANFCRTRCGLDFVTLLRISLLFRQTVGYRSCLSGKARNREFAIARQHLGRQPSVFARRHGSLRRRERKEVAALRQARAQGRPTEDLPARPEPDRRFATGKPRDFRCGRNHNPRRASRCERAYWCCWRS